MGHFHSKKTFAAGLSKDDFRTAVLHERRMELAFEGQRWFDLVRINKHKRIGRAYRTLNNRMAYLCIFALLRTRKTAII